MCSVIDDVCALADEMVFNGDVQEAIDFITEAIIVSPPTTNVFKLWWQRAGCNFIAGRYADAIKDFEAAAVIMPGEQVAFFQTYGAMLCVGGRWFEAAPVFDKALGLEGIKSLQLTPPKFMHRMPVAVVQALRAKCAGGDK